MQEISKKINRDKSTTTVLIRKLENLSLVKSQVSETDSRMKYIELTDEGKEYNKLTKEISDNLKNKFFKSFSDLEIQKLSSLLNKICQNFNSDI